MSFTRTWQRPVRNTTFLVVTVDYAAGVTRRLVIESRPWAGDERVGDTSGGVTVIECPLRPKVALREYVANSIVGRATIRERMVRDRERERDEREDTAERDDTAERNRTMLDRSRRNVLKIAGAGAGLAALGGLSTTGVGQEDGGTPTATPTETPTPGAGDAAEDEHFVADLVDPVFGYPLAGGETDDLELEHVVDVTFVDGGGSHEGFPQEPDEDAPGQFVEVPAEFFFDPVGLHVEPGDLVHFDTVAGLHTVTAFHEKFSEPNLDVPTRVPDDVPGFTAPPMTPGESWVYQFTEPGVYDYFCFPHLGLGMVGRIVVLDPEEDDVDSETFAAPTAGELFPNGGAVFSAPELDPATIVEAGSVAWADLTFEVQGTPTGTGTPETETDTPTETGGS